METRIIDGNTYYLPATVSDVQELITNARQLKTEIRIRGSKHSVPQSIYPDNTPAKPGIFVMLSKMRSVQFIKTQTKAGLFDQAVVGAGCNLGYDPFDPTFISSWNNSLFCQMDNAGFAVPDMGGIIHQAIGGFISTGSSGGSVQHSFDDSIYSITFIPADKDNPDPITVCRDDANTDLFDAVGVSLGLLGIIVSVTLNLIPKFNITGSEISSADNQNLDFDFLGDRNDPALLTFEQFLQQTEYTRVIWYPQPGIRKLTVWKANQMKPDAPFTRNPYYEFAQKPLDAFLEMFGIDLFYTLAGTWPNWWEAAFGNTKDMSIEEQVLLAGIKQQLQTKYYPEILPKAINFFIPTNLTDPKLFMDYWWSSLPMDNNVSDTIMHVEFTELWISIDQTAAVMKALNDIFATFYKQTCPGPGGSFNTEIYAAKSSNFWLSPSYGQDVVRIDVFWFANNNGLPTDSYYPIFWEGLKQFNYRCHWGKYIPSGDDPNVGVNYISSQYPKWKAFMNLRDTFDPMQVFVNDYWRGHLGILPIKNS